jgi:signal transduction histidine kinase
MASVDEMKVLVIEDEQQVSNFIKQGLEEQDFEVDVAFDGSIGERLALSRDYNVILLDIIIPGVNGFELCRKIKSRKPELPVLMLTTLGMTEDKIAGFDAGVVSIVGYVYAGRILRPVSRIVRDVETITEESLDKRLEEGNTKDELARLAQTFNRMLARLQSAFISQKSFIANASHELKTPFTVMAGEIEVTLLQPREKEYYIRILSSVLETIKRFNRLSTQLLLLAQTSSDNPTRKFHILRIDDVLWEAKYELEKYHSDYRIDLEFDINIHYENLLVKGDEQLLKVLIMNLMDNGCKYANDKTVSVSILTGADNFLNITFSNTGEGIKHEDLSKIFDPFYRGTTATKRKGFGIGLSLAEKVIKLHNGTIYVTSNPGELTCFVIGLPIFSGASMEDIKKATLEE